MSCTNTWSFPPPLRCGINPCCLWSDRHASSHLYLPRLHAFSFTSTPYSQKYMDTWPSHLYELYILDIPFQIQNPEKQPQTIIPPPPNFTVGTVHPCRCCSPGICKTQIRPSDCQTVKPDSSLQQMCFHWSRDSHWHPLHGAPNAQFLSWCCSQRRFGTRKWGIQRHFSTRQPRSVSLRGLQLQGSAVVAPRRFYLALTVDQGRSSTVVI